MNVLSKVEDLFGNMEHKERFLTDLLVADLNGCVDGDLAALPVHLDLLIMILVQEGSMELSVDHTRHMISKNMFVTLIPVHAVQVLMVSEDLKGKLLAVSKGFLAGYKISDQQDHSFLNYMQIRVNPCTEFSAEAAGRMSEQFDMIKNKMQCCMRYYYKEMLQNAIACFYIELANIFMKLNKSVETSALSRKYEIFENFLKLLYLHCRKQHSVRFYADCLYITPQYLSLVLRELTGKSVRKWINETLIMEAKTMLKAPAATVQQVAAQLYFSDQSTFGKFFKKETGLSPTEYWANMDVQSEDQNM